MSKTISFYFIYILVNLFFFSNFIINKNKKQVCLHAYLEVRMYSTTSYKNASNIQDYNSKSDGLDQLKAQQPLQTQRSSNSNNTSNQRSIPYNSSKTNLAGSTRLQQIILTNQSSLNNIISELNLKRLPSASSLNTTSNTNYSNIFNGNESYSVLVKSPFKHYRNQNASNSRMNKSNASSKSNSVNDVNNSNLSTPKTDASSRNINYNQLESVVMRLFFLYFFRKTFLIFI